MASSMEVLANLTERLTSSYIRSCWVIDCANVTTSDQMHQGLPDAHPTSRLRLQSLPYSTMKTHLLGQESILLIDEMLIKRSSHCPNYQQNDKRNVTVYLLSCKAFISLHRTLDSYLLSAQKRHRSFSPLRGAANLQPLPFPLITLLLLSISRSP
jgi:hypothetical protein